MIDEVRAKIESAVPRLRIEFVQILSDVINDLAGAARPVEIKLFGSDLDALESVRGAARAGDGEGRRARGLLQRRERAVAELLMTINGAEANRVGLTPDQVAAAVSGALLGVQAGEVRLQDRVDRRARARAGRGAQRCAPPRRAAGGDPGAAATTAPLSALATFEPTEARSACTRENQQQMITMTSDVTGARSAR